MTPGTLTGTYNLPDLSARDETVYIEPSVSPIRDTTGKVVIDGKVPIKLDGTGSFSTPLAATDDLTLDPSGVTYTVRRRGLKPLVGVRVLAGQTVDISGITPVAPDAPQYAAWTYGTGGGTGGGFDDAAAQAEFAGALTW